MKRFAVVLLASLLCLTAVPAVTGCPTAITAEAHSGRTDANGGHHDNKNKSGLGSYHYHCGGNPAHLHENGVCPYASSGSVKATQPAAAPAPAADVPAPQFPSAGDTSQQGAAQLSAEDALASMVTQTQTWLQAFGYYSGEINGVFDETTQQALTAFQTAYGLTVDGMINAEIIQLFGITV